MSAPHPTIQNATLEWAFSGDANANAQVQVRFRPAGTSTWLDGMPLRRVQGGTNSTVGYSWSTRHSGSLFDLAPATTYDVEMSLVDPDGGATTRSLQLTTRAVPTPMAGAPVKAVTPATFAGVMASAQPGDIIELAAGDYSGLSISRDGSATRPLVVRRAASAAPGSVVYRGELSLIGRQYVHVQGLSIEGRIRYNGSTGLAIMGNTVQAVAAVGNGEGIVSWAVAEDAYIADNTVIGTGTWNEAALGVNGNNLGEGILVNGPGHVVMNNRVRGFRDDISLLEGGSALEQYSIDILNNDLSEAADDAIEADYCHHNCRIMRNRITNAFIAMSSQPSLGGPTYFIRNVAYNIAHVAFKLYNSSRGDVLLHNTIVKNGDAFGAYPGVTIAQLLAQNNLFIGGAGATWGGYSSGSGAVVSLADLDTASSLLDYNAYGNQTGSFSGRIGATRFTSLAGLRSTTTEAHATQVDLSVFAASVAYPANAMSTFTAPDLRLPNINDGFAGAAPDAGAYEAGAALPVYGVRP